MEGGLFFTNFAHFWSSFDNRCFNHRFNHWLRLNHWGWLNRNHFNFWQGFLNRCDFHFGNNRSFDRGDGFYDWRFNHRRFYHWGFGDWRFNDGGFFDGSGRTFSLLVRLGFSRSADDRAGNGGGNGQAGSQFAVSGFDSCSFGVLAGFFRAFDHVAVGITLTLTTVAATTLATGAAAWAIAFGAVLTVFLRLLFSGQHFFVFAGSGLLGTRLTLFTRWAWSAFFTWRTFFAWLASRALFSDSGGACSGNSRCCVQRLAQFTYTFFTLATWLAIFTRGTWRTWCAFFTRCTFFAGYGWGFFTGFARGTFFTRCAFFTWRTLFARLAFFVTATVAVTALLTAVATLFVACWALGGWFFNHNRSSRLFFSGEQADQRLHQAFEQAWLRQGGQSVAGANQHLAFTQGSAPVFGRRLHGP